MPVLQSSGLPFFLTQDLEKGNWDLNCLSDDCEEQEEEENAVMDFVPPPSGPRKSDAAESPAGKPEVELNASDQMTAPSEQPAGDKGPVMNSVSTQTENGPGRPNAAAVQLVSATTQTDGDDREVEEESVESPPLSPVQLPPAETEADARMLLAASFPIPADPARLAERIRRNRTQLSAAFDDTEYEPYGLPEVVMKGGFQYGPDFLYKYVCVSCFFLFLLMMSCCCWL